MMRTAAHLAPETEPTEMELLIPATVEKKKQTITKNLSSNTFGNARFLKLHIGCNYTTKEFKTKKN